MVSMAQDWGFAFRSINMGITFAHGLRAAWNSTWPNTLALGEGHARDLADPSAPRPLGYPKCPTEPP